MSSLGRHPDRDASFAVLFGFSGYQDHEHYADLPAVDRGLTDLASALSDPLTGGFAPANCQVRTGPLSVEGVGIQLQRAANKARDTLLVYYCGHGIIDRGPLHAGSLYLAFPATREDYFRFTSMALRELKSVIASSPARCKILIIDCCHSGLAHTQGAADLSQELDVEGMYILSSTSGIDYAWAPPGARYTAFTGALIDALNASTQEPDPVPLNEIYLQVRASMQPRRLSIPNQSSERTAGQIALVRPRRPRPAEAIPVREGLDARPVTPLPSSWWMIPPRHDWPAEGVLDLLRHHVNDPVRAVDVEHGVGEMASRLLLVLSEDQPPPAPDATSPEQSAALGRRLASHEQAVAPMLRAFALGGRYGEPRHDMTWLRVLDQVLNQRHTRPAGLRDDFAAADRYPALLLVTTLGIAAVASGRAELAYRALTEIRYKPPGGEHRSALLALTPLRVVAPGIAASLPGWEYEPAELAVCAHVRQHLRDAFTGVISASDYPRMFATWEYLRSLLTFDAGLFTRSLYAEGPEAINASELPLDLTDRSQLLRAGAFGGDIRRVVKAQGKIEASLHWGS